MLSALMFVLGFSTVFIALGASASVIGLIRAKSAQLSIVAGIVIISMGLLARLKRHLASVERAMGVLLIVTGVVFLIGSMSGISIRLLETSAAEFRLTSRNNSGFRDETPAAVRAKFKQLIWGAL
jgi:hypothetical protein